MKRLFIPKLAPNTYSLLQKLMEDILLSTYSVKFIQIMWVNLRANRCGHSLFLKTLGQQQLWMTILWTIYLSLYTGADNY